MSEPPIMKGMARLKSVFFSFFIAFFFLLIEPVVRFSCGTKKAGLYESGSGYGV